MKLHRNARTNPFSRKLLVSRIRKGWAVLAAAEAVGVSRSTAYKWLRRWQDEGHGGLQDRSSAPHHIPHRTPDRLVRRIERLRRHKHWTGRAISHLLQVATSTVSGILRRLGLGRLKDFVPRPKVVRYEREEPGELLHFDIKKLGRFRCPGHRVTGRRSGYRYSRRPGWDFVHVCIDDHSRVAHAEIHDDERHEAAVAFLQRTVAWYRRRRIRIDQVLTDNGSCYRSYAFREACAALGIRHITTRPYRPQTNGKAERLIKTLLDEWAYAKPYRSSGQRAKALGPWLEYYNRERPHGSLGYEPPVSRLRARV